MSAPMNGTARWQLVLSAAGIGIIVLGAIVTLYVQLATMSGQLRGLDARMDAISRRTQVAEERISDQRSRIDRIDSSLMEVETQFRGEAMARNVIHANDMRTQAMLWEKAFKVRYPTDNAYYPSIAK